MPIGYSEMNFVAVEIVVCVFSAFNCSQYIAEHFIPMAPGKRQSKSLVTGSSRVLRPRSLLLDMLGRLMLSPRDKLWTTSMRVQLEVEEEE